MIFILSTERAGSTLLRVLLDSHPQVAAPGELGLGELCHRLVVVLGRTVGQCAPGLPAPLSSESWLAGEQPPGPASELVRQQTRAAVDQIMGDYARARGKTRWCNKTPGDLHYADLFRLLWPEARFLCLHRQGYDVAASCLEVSQHGFMRELAPYVMASPTNTVAAMLRSWTEKTEKILDFERRWPGACHRLLYEDLVREPQSTLERALEFLGLEPCPHLHHMALRQPHHRGGGDPKVWQTDAVRSDRVGTGQTLPKGHIPGPLAAQVRALHEQLGYQGESGAL
jgi:protein-tyrosine sulfotransferase